MFYKMILVFCIYSTNIFAMLNSEISPINSQQVAEIEENYQSLRALLVLEKSFSQHKPRSSVSSHSYFEEINGEQQQRDIIKKMLIKEPHKILERNESLSRAYINEVCISAFKNEGAENFIRRFLHVGKEFIERERAVNPIFLLRECDRFSCPCNRHRYPDKRERFEKIVVAELLKRTFPTYVNTNSNRLFPDIHILEAAFSQGLNGAHVVLIDPCFKNALRIKQLLSEHKEIEIDERLTHAQEEVERIRQFSDWFKEEYPHKEILFHWYDSVSEYARDTELNENLLADVYVGEDLEFGEKGSFHSFDSVKPRVLKASGTALMLLNYKNEAILMKTLPVNEREEGDRIDAASNRFVVVKFFDTSR